MRMSLASLPAELLQIICRHVSEVDFFGSGVQEYRGLSLSCHTLYKIARPFLYRRLDLPPQKTFLLLRSITENPELVLGIESVTLFGCAMQDTQLDLGQAYTLLRKPGLLPESCTQYLDPNDSEAITALLIETLILQLSHVVELSISIGGFLKSLVFFDEERWKPGNRDSLSQLVPALKTLNVYARSSKPKQLKVPIEGDELQEDRPRAEDGEQILQEDEQESQEDEWESIDDESDFEENERDSQRHVDIVSQVQRLLALSTPQELYLETGFILPYRCFWLRLPSVVKLAITCEGMHPEHFNMFLRSCPNVHSLNYYGGSGPPPTDDFDESLNVRGIITALECRQHELESLEIAFHQEEDGYIMEYDTIPNMRHFSRLTTLQLDCDALFEVPQDTIFLPTQDAKVRFIDKFPQTLKTLRIF